MTVPPAETRPVPNSRWSKLLEIPMSPANAEQVILNTAHRVPGIRLGYDAALARAWTWRRTAVIRELEAQARTGMR